MGLISNLPNKIYTIHEAFKVVGTLNACEIDNWSYKIVSYGDQFKIGCYDELGNFVEYFKL